MTTGNVTWESDERLIIGDTAYSVMTEASEPSELRLFKPRSMIEAYEPIIAEFQGGNIFELGIFEGGSAAYLTQRCDPDNLVAIDLSPDRVIDLDRFVAEHHLEDRVRLHYDVDQADRAKLREVAADGFAGRPIDLVIDDASHFYHPTVASFEALFPLVGPGGLYVIEDWNPDDYLALAFRDALAHEDRIARAIVEDWISSALLVDQDLFATTFRRWIVGTLLDPSAADHDIAVRWRAALDEPFATETASQLGARLDELVAAGLPDSGGPTLGTLALQLLLAVKGLCPAISSVEITPYWIAVRRAGPEDLERITIESIGRDPLGVLETHAEGHQADRELAEDPRGPTRTTAAAPRHR